MTDTTNFNFALPDINASTDTWGTELNAIFVSIDSVLKTNQDSAAGAQTTAASAGQGAVAAATAAADAQTAADNAATAAAAADTKAQSAIDGLGGITLGTAASQDTGTSGATIPLLNGANTWASDQVFSGTITTQGVKVARVASGTAPNSGLISFGTGAPGALAEGQIYLRHE